MNAITSIIPENEAGRMAAVRRYDVLDTPPDGAFDRITAIAARRFNVPMERSASSTGRPGRSTRRRSRT